MSALRATWECSACTLVNAASASACSACELPYATNLLLTTSTSKSEILAANSAADAVSTLSLSGIGSGSNSTTPASALLDPSKLTERVCVLVELRDGSGSGGVVCAEPGTHAAARAGLVLLALQLAPLMRLASGAGLLPVGARLLRLCEVHPEDAASAGARAEVPDVAVPADIVLRIACRHARSLLPLEPLVLRRAALRALAGARPGIASESSTTAAAVTAAATAELEALYAERCAGRVPASLQQLERMGVLPRSWREDYAAAATASATPTLPTSTGGVAGSPRARSGAPAGGPAGEARPSLWWPPPATAITFAELQRRDSSARQAAADAAVSKEEQARAARIAALKR